MKTVDVKWSSTRKNDDGTTTKQEGTTQCGQIEEGEVKIKVPADYFLTGDQIVTLTNRQLVTDARNDAARGPSTKVSVNGMVEMLMKAPFNKTREEAEAAVRTAQGKV